jgi:type 1 glutamine amidotransferase
VFYTALGHEEGVWRDARFQTLLHNAVRWAIRDR